MPAIILGLCVCCLIYLQQHCEKVHANILILNVKKNLFFSQLFVRPPQTAILVFAFLFHEDGLDPCLLYNVMNLIP